MRELSLWQEVALIAGPAIAAVAACASWASVWQARKLARDSRSPLLMIQKVVERSTQTVGAVVTNAGGGAARGIGIFLSHPPFWVQGAVLHGFLYPGQSRYIKTDIPLNEEEETDVMVVCRDAESFAHFWTADEKHRVFKTRFRRRPRYRRDLVEVFHELHPGADLPSLTQATFTVSNDVP
jgi:hypothetical protein